MPSSSQDCLENFLESFFTVSLPNTCRENTLCHVHCVVSSVCLSWLPAQTHVPVSRNGTSSLKTVSPSSLLSLWPSPLYHSLRLEAPRGRDCLLARAESSVGTHWKDSICRFFSLKGSEEELNMKTCQLSVFLCPLEVFLRKIKLLNWGSLGMHHFGLSRGWLPRVLCGCVGLGWQWVPLHLPAWTVLGGSGDLSFPMFFFPAKFPLGLIMIPAEVRTQGCASFVTHCKPELGKNECSRSL